MKTPINSGRSSPVTTLSPREAERNRLSTEWVNAHWNEIEDGTLEEQAELRKAKEAWIEAELAKAKV